MKFVMKKIRILLSLLLTSAFLLSNASGLADAEGLSNWELIEILGNREFNFSSGVGGWGTNLYIGSDGYFFGIYHDSDMGVSGDGYPNGTLFYCPFEGKFTFPEYVPEGATSVQITLESIYYHGLEKYGESVESYGEENRDGVRLIYSGPYGLEGTKTFTLYFPQHLKAYTSEEFRSWARSTGIGAPDYNEDQLGFFALCNDINQQGFSSHIVSENRSQILKYIIATGIEAEKKSSVKGLSVAEMTDSSEAVYRIWDNALNAIWSVILNNIGGESKQYLIESETKWIDWKEISATKEASQFAGSSLHSLYYYTALADRTRWRCYDLLDYFYP